MRRALAILALMSALWACAAPQPASPPEPLLFAPEDLGQARSVVIGIPGALTSVKVLFPIEAWRTEERTIAYYRLPGFDDYPDSAPFSIDGAAYHLADFVERGDFEQVYFVGHSTGAAIALETAKILRHTRPETDVHVAGISTALPNPQPILAGFRTAGGTVASIARTGSLNPRVVWLDYYRRVSYGPDVSKHADLAARANILVEARSDQITLPQRGLGRKHFGAIIAWENLNPETLDGVDIDFWHGGVDLVFPARPVRRFVETLPQADLHLLEDHGHVILLTYPEIWDEMAAQWGWGLD